MFGALLDDAVPPGLIGFRPVGFSCRAIELDDLKPGIGLPFRVFCVLRVEFGNRFRFPALGGLAQHGPLGIGQFVPGGLVHEYRNFGGIKSGINAIFCLLMPAEIENPGDRPAISVDDAALKRCIDFAWRSLHHRGAERLEEVAIDRRDAIFKPVRSGVEIGLFR